ncbi:DUF1707 domain-containing protein [Streptomyces varsoviensis]|uniref:DUF1707 SHOCT-like domain-containing protein n=1 Tax=Streptomyces varsoviensis TaxID=67373 RepID=UPI0034021E89
MSVPVGSLPGVRASTRERDQAIEALTEHVVEGRLTDAEFEARSDKARSAASRDELLRLFDDLPQPRPVFDAAAEPGLPAPAADQASAPATRAGGTDGASGAGDSAPAVRGQGGAAPAKLSGAAAAAVYGMFPAAGVIAVVLMVLTGAWYWLLIVPPVAYGARQVAKKRRGRD